MNYKLTYIFLTAYLLFFMYCVQMLYTVRRIRTSSGVRTIWRTNVYDYNYVHTIMPDLRNYFISINLLIGRWDFRYVRPCGNLINRIHYDKTIRTNT